MVKYSREANNRKQALLNNDLSRIPNKSSDNQYNNDNNFTI